MSDVSLHCRKSLQDYSKAKISTFVCASAGDCSWILELLTRVLSVL